MILRSTPSRPIIAICFFGITRAASVTSPSIESRIIAPMRKIGLVKTYAHLYRQQRVFSPRSGEDAAIDPDEWKILNLDTVRLEDPDDAGLGALLDCVKNHGDAFDNGFASTTNLIRQLHSLASVFEMAREDRPNLWIFARPDLLYHDSLLDAATRTLRSSSDQVRIPRWQHYDGGINDRFAICSSERAARAYARRIDDAMIYCQEHGPLHSERLLRYRMNRAGIKPRTMPARASRVRVGGRIENEDFRSWWTARACRLPVIATIRFLDAIGLWRLLRPIARRLAGIS